MVVGEAPSAVEFDGGVAVVDFQVENLGVVLAGDVLCQVQELSPIALPAVRGFDEEFVDQAPLPRYSRL